MRVLVPGHCYALANLKGAGETILQFYQDPHLHDGEGADGPSCQEVLRALIERIQTLDDEKPWPLNEGLIQRAREMIALFEMRALFYKVQKGGLAIETLPIGEDGHLMFIAGGETEGLGMALERAAKRLTTIALAVHHKTPLPASLTISGWAAEARLWLLCDSGSDPEGENSRSEVECEASQSGGEAASPKPHPSGGSHD